VTLSRCLSVAALLVLPARLTAADPNGAPPAPRLITTQWLAEHLSDTGLRVVDLRSGVKYYWERHIPGAVFLHPDALRLPDHGVPEKPMPPGILAQVLGRAGIDRNTTVVIYAEALDSLSPYLIWQLDCLGHERSAVLAGGLDKWLAEGRPVTQNYPAIEPVEYVLPDRLSPAARATWEDVKQVVEKDGAVLLDVRPPAQFAGAKGTWMRKGRIPGAVNRDWVEDLGEAGMLKDSLTLGQAYAAIGITPAKPVIIYCGRGYRSTNTWFVLRHVLGFPDVRVYDGGFSEWSSIPSLPVEIGDPTER